MKQEHLNFAIEKMGREPINPIGQCFESTAHEAMGNPDLPEEITICHGVGTANMPGQEGWEIGHAWIESGDTAYDTTWGVATQAKHYRDQLHIKYFVRYTFREFIRKWANEGYPGPWDKKIKAVVDDKKKEGETPQHRADSVERNNDARELEKAPINGAADESHSEEA